MDKVVVDVDHVDVVVDVDKVVVVVDVYKVVVVDVDKGSGGECWPRASAFSLQSAGASPLVGTDAKISKS